MEITTLADIPELSAERSPRSRITVARLGKYQDARYGKFEIADIDYQGWKQNLAATFGGKVSIDFDHSSDRGRGTEAAGWITGLEREGEDVIADVQWTPKGAAAVRDKAYQFISPTYVNNYKDERGVDRGRALLGAACTNRPVLRQLPTLSLSRESIDGVATLASGRSSSPKRERKRARAELAKLLAANTEPERDSRPQMPTLPELATLLGLPEDSDHVTVLAAAAQISPAPPKAQSAPSAANPGATGGAAATAAAKAAQQGAKATKKAKKLAKKQRRTMSLSAEDTANLVTAANAGQAASLQLAEQSFTVAWEKCLSEGRAAPSQEDTMRALHRENAELALKTLDSFVPIVPVAPTGTGAGAGSTGPAPLGMDENRFALHTQAKALAHTKREASPDLPEDEAYSLAVNELSERQFALENPGI
ncbi:MAG: hypothetical protein NVSMB18_36420 [Acetobacteraceae bacterium]